MPTLVDGDSVIVDSMTIGASGVYAFVGLGGPYWTDSNGTITVLNAVTAGGTGKTPAVLLAAENLRRHGHDVAILSRGYKSRPVPLWRQAWIRLTHTAEPPPRVVSDGVRVLLDSELAGDALVQLTGTR